jgi:Xaa-Pro aminopeptidase
MSTYQAILITIEYISGFSGSAGCAVITLEKAALATDGRYFNQAAKQLDQNWHLIKTGLPDVLSWPDWTAKESEGGKTVGVDPSVITSTEAKRLSDKIKKKGGADLVAVTDNLVDAIWGNERAPRPNEPVKPLDTTFSGKKFEEKIESLRKELEKKDSGGFVVCKLFT